MAHVAHSIAGTKRASGKISWYLGHPNPAVLKLIRSGRPLENGNGSELRHRKGQRIVYYALHRALC